MKSAKWQVVRRAVLARDGGCKQCQNKNSVKLDVHHKKYRYFGRGDVLEIQDCICLCRVCHDQKHGKNFMSKIDANLAKWLK